jgi:uncharacterized membrane protein YfcA
MVTDNTLMNILLFTLVGFVAQIIDGALGMAYGVSSTTFLLSIGVPPAIASATIHTAEVFTTAASGFSHLRLGNVNKKLVGSLLIPGVIGGVVGAYILTNIPTNIIKPIVAAYLLIMGVLILIKAFRKAPEATEEPKPLLLALVGGFFDAVGGGGWGPIVTSTLVARGHNPRFTIGSVNTTEFFVTTAEAITFFAVIGALLLQSWPVIVGLLLGGVIAAPLAALVCKKLPAKTLMIMVGTLITLLSIRTISLALFAK